MRLDQFRRSIVFVFIHLLLLFFLPANVHAQEVRYDILEAQIEGDVSADGSIHFQEIYTFAVSHINGINHQVDFEGSRISDYRVGILDSKTGEINYFSEQNSQQPMTFRTSLDNQIIKFQLFYPVDNQEVKFVFEYRLNEVVTNYYDTAQINRKLVGEHTDDTMDVNIQINLPARVENMDDFRAWGHGHYTGEVSLFQGDSQSYLLLRVPDNPPNQFVELNTIFPTALTPNNPNISPIGMKESIIQAEEEQRQVDLAAYQKQQWLTGSLIAFLSLLIPAGTIYTYVYYLRKHRALNPNPAHVPEHLYQLPADITPALMATAVLRDKPKADDFSATIVDLARKEFVLIEEVKRDRRGNVDSKGTSTVAISKHPQAGELGLLQKHERYVYEYLLPNDQATTLLEIEEKIRSNKNYKKQQFRKWTQFANYVEVMGHQLRQQAPEKRKAVKYSFFTVISAVTLLIVAIILVAQRIVAQGHSLIIGVAVSNLVAAILILFLSIYRPIRTYEEDRMRKEWRSFARMLEDIGNFKMREIASLSLWESYLSYAISLDLADRVIEAMNQQYGVEDLQSMHLPSVFYHNPYWINSVIRPTMYQTIEASSPPAGNGNFTGSNSGGFGGGFSGGSSGGFGGGGGTSGF